jgi:hypothetical protein
VALSVTMAGLLACGPVVSSRPPSVEPGWERVVAPFAVLDEQGRPYPFPFLGGFNLPRPQLADVDGDGDQDLVVQEYRDKVFVFRRDEDSWSLAASAFAHVDVGEWFRFVDMDADGDVDLLSEQPFSYIRYYRNDGAPGRPRFVVAADTLLDTDGRPIFSDRQNIPNVVDLDCDGLLDLFIGRVSGTVVHYEEVHRDPQGVPRFQLVAERFEDIEIVAQLGSLHGANTLAFHDVDADGDPDLFWGDFFEPGLLLIENTGTCATPVLRNSPVPFPPTNPVSTSGYNAPTFGDVDGDTVDDLIVGVIGGAFNSTTSSVDNLYWLRRDPDGGSSAFVERTRRFIGALDVGSESTVAAGDLDGDGDTDLVIGSKLDPLATTTGRLFLLENVGSAGDPRFALGDTLQPVEAYHYAPALGDLDGDGDLDLVLGTWGADLRYVRNEGSRSAPRFVSVDGPLVTLTRGSHATPALGDLDGDGDQDLMVGESSGTLNYYRNEGTGTEARYVLVSDRFLEIDVGRRSAPTLADLDGDRDLDLAIGTDDGSIVTYRNVGDARSPQFVPDSLLDVDLPPLVTPAFVDLDGDGRLELMVGTEGGGLLYLRRGRRRSSP